VTTTTAVFQRGSPADNMDGNGNASGGSSSRKSRSYRAAFLLASVALVTAVSIGTSVRQTSRLRTSPSSSLSSTPPSTTTTTTTPSAMDAAAVQQQQPQQQDSSSLSDSNNNEDALRRTETESPPTAAGNEDGSDEKDDKGDEKKMNIVLFYADDWTWRTVGAVNPLVKTPNLDEMAKNGMLFTHNCVTTSICWQSRATLVTGMYAARHQQLTISSEAIFNRTVNWSDTLYPLLKRHGGYHIGYVGKWHAPLPEEFSREAFDYVKEYYGDHWMPRRGKMQHVTHVNGVDALWYLRGKRPKEEDNNRQQKPFALTVSFFATHSWDEKEYPDQYMAQNHTESLYRDVFIPEPKTATREHYKALPKFLRGESECRNRWLQRYNTPGTCLFLSRQL